MGGFYANLTVRSDSQQAIAKILQGLGRRAYVCPPACGNVVVLDQGCDSQNYADIEFLGTQLSAVLQRPVLAVLDHDDDVFYYWLFDGGNLIDQYDSSPDYFNFVPGDVDIVAAAKDYTPAPPSGGSARLLCDAFECPDAVVQVETILRKPSSEYVFASERHEDLAKALRMSNHSLGTAFASFEYQTFPDDLDSSQCIRVG